MYKSKTRRFVLPLVMAGAALVPTILATAPAAHAESTIVDSATCRAASQVAASVAGNAIGYTFCYVTVACPGYADCLIYGRSQVGGIGTVAAQIDPNGASCSGINGCAVPYKYLGHFSPNKGIEVFCAYWSPNAAVQLTGACTLDAFLIL
jgi:hypothetical protein